MERVFEESGLRVTLQDGVWFRFNDCGAYGRIKGRQVSEMDFGWWDEARQAICLLELKDYSVHEPARELIPKLVAKGRDCLVMLRGAWNDLGDVSRELRGELPETCRTERKLRLFFVLKVGAEGFSRETLNPMKDRLANEIKAYAELLGIQLPTVLLLDHQKAIEKGLPLTVIDSEPAG